MSLLADAECPKVAFENVELKENNENGKVREVGKEGPGDKCKRLCRDNKVVTFLICLIIIGIAIGLVIGFIIGKMKKERVVISIPTNYRLTGHLVPKHYVLETQPYIIPKYFTFDGKVEILVDCVQETDKVILHSKDLTINEDDIRVRNMGSESNIKVTTVEYNETMSFLILHLAENMEKGNAYLIFLSFNGKLQRSGKGFYVSSYYDEDERVHYVASTQYEAIHAREGFPCFDEPHLKATFEITLVRWKNMSSLSNMPRVKTERRGTDWVADTFLTSLKMSSYVVAYYVGEYVGKVDRKVRVWAPKHKADFVDFSLDLGNKVLPYFEDKVGIPYAPPKLDMVPVTELVAAAMENWGLIIYTDNQLLYNAGKKSAETKQSIATTVAHEIAHQWFGNLVTPTWWSDIWLSEGMTTYMENMASMHLFPEWNGIDKTIKNLYDSVYENDCYDEYGATVWKNITAERITLPGQTFGTLTYFKGAMVGRMMHHILGNDTFWRGISSYLKEYSYGNVEEKNLWKHLTAAQLGNKKVDMAKVIRTWTHTSGAPIVTVKRDYDSKTATFTQRSCKTRNTEEFSGDLWHVPISYTTPRKHDWNPEIQAWLTEREVTIKDMPKHDEWILLNGNSVGYYLVNYDERNWALLAAQLRKNHEVFSVDQRYKLLADANMLYKFKNISLEVILDLSSYLGNEKILSVLSYPNTNFISETKQLMEYSSYEDYWGEYMISILAPMQERLGWEDDPKEELRITRQLRMEANRMLCNLNYPPSVEEAARRFKIYMVKGDNQTAVTMFNKEYIFCAAVRSGRREIIDYFLKNDVDGDQLDYLACSHNETIIMYIFDILDDGWKSSYYSVVVKLMQNRKYWIRFIQFLDNHLDNSNDNPYSWFMAMRRSARSEEQKEMFRNLIRKYLHKVPKENKAAVEELLEEKDWEDEIREKGRNMGKWFQRRVWAK